MKKIAALLIGVFLFFSVASPAQAYEDDMHYYMVYWMCGQIGFGPQYQAKIALSNLTTDTSSKTEPMAEMNPYKDSANERRRNWHFPGFLHEKRSWTTTWVKSRYYENATQNSYYGLYNTLRAQGQKQGKNAESINPYYMGMSLHSYMDTYAHEGYGARFGHASAGFDPDRPHMFEDKTKKMLDRTFTQLVNFARLCGHVSDDKINNAINGKKRILKEGWEIINSYDRGIDNDWDTYKRFKVSEARHNSVMSMRFEKWRDKGQVNKSPNYAKEFLSWDIKDKDWEKNALKKFKLPWKISEVSGMDKLPIPLEANDFEMPEAYRHKQEFFIEYCDVSEEDRIAVIYNVIKEYPQILVYSRYYPEEFQEKLKCAAELVRTREGLETLMDFVENDGSGIFQVTRNYIAIRIISALGWGTTDMEAVILPLLDSQHKDARMVAAWAAHEYGIERPQVLADIFDDIRQDERSSKNDDRTLEGDGRLVDLLPIAGEYLSIWEQYYKYGEPYEAAKAAFALYAIGTKERPAAAANGVNSVDVITQAINILQAGSGKNGPVEDVLKYWQIRSYEDIDDEVNDSLNDDRQIQGLTRLIREAVKNGNNEHIMAAAVAASTYSPKDGVEMELVEELSKALDIKDSAVKSEVGYAIQQISGKSFDLTDEGLETIEEATDTWIKERF